MSHDLENASAQPEWTRRSLLTSLPFWLTMIRILQLMLSFLILCLAGYVVNVFGGDYFHTFGMSFTTFVWTVIFMGYILITPRRFPKLYSYKVHITLEVLATCFWIATVSLFSWECQTWDAAEDVVADVLTEEQAALVNSVPNQEIAIRALRAATALSGINTFFFAVTMFILRRVLLQGRVQEDVE